jgi:hypothetical protein
MTKSREQAGNADTDVLANLARTVGSALGTVVAKVSKTQKAVEPKRSKKKISPARRAKTAGKRRVTPKRRK